MSNEPTSSAARPTGRPLSALESTLGYTFQHPELLHSALTHKSHSRNNYERLEFIGDAVLGYLIGIMLYRRDAGLAEDALSLMRAKVVRRTTLAEVAREIDLAGYLKLGGGERKSGGRHRDSIQADALEAVLGAVHEDGGIEACRALVERLFGERVAALDPQDLKDAKTRLQELLQGRQLKLPLYDVVEVSGADHQRSYTVSCAVPELDLVYSATANSRRGAEQAAAEAVLASPELAGTAEDVTGE